MFNERTKYMGIESYCVPNNNASYHQDYWKCAALPPLENATDVKGCDCYIKKENDQILAYG